MGRAGVTVAGSTFGIGAAGQTHHFSIIASVTSGVRTGVLVAAVSVTVRLRALAQTARELESLSFRSMFSMTMSKLRFTCFFCFCLGQSQGSQNRGASVGKRALTVSICLDGEKRSPDIGASPGKSQFVLKTKIEYSIHGDAFYTVRLIRLHSPHWAAVDGFLDKRVPTRPAAAAGRLTLNT